MKTIGIIGGSSWVSSAEYYRIINSQVAERLGGLHSARILMASVNFAEVNDMLERGDWPAIGELLAATSRSLQSGGADCIIMACNTLHRAAPAIERAAKIPFIHITDALATALRRDGITRIGLLGSTYTMQSDIYHSRLAAAGIRAITPAQPEQEQIHRIIIDELCHNKITPEARRTMAAIIARLAASGAQATALACTELPLIADPQSPTPLYDTAKIHCQTATHHALAP